jgi:hypothetical protein
LPESFSNERFKGDDFLITKKSLETACKPFLNSISNAPCLIVRSLPNSTFKLSTNYSNTNPTYFEKEAVEYILELGIDHLVVDLPSIDREEDAGELIGHHTFWSYPENPQIHKTITELAFIDDSISNGRYIANFQITSLENDASPSKITLYQIQSE